MQPTEIQGKMSKPREIIAVEMKTAESLCGGDR
jgi:hypothetical protein